jgi:hypothetical protein
MLMLMLLGSWWHRGRRVLQRGEREREREREVVQPPREVVGRLIVE